MEKDKDYYLITKNGVEYRVLTELYLTKRGFCCGNECVNCPYLPKHQKGNTFLNSNKK